MIDSILTEIGKLKWVIVIYSAIIILLSGFFWFYTKKFNFSKAKTTIFAIFYDLNYWQVFALGLIVGRLVFTLCFAIFCENIHWGHFIILVIFSIGICLTTKDYKNIPNEVLNTVAAFVMLFIQSALYGYYQEVEHLWAVLVMSILLGLFAFLYIALQSLSSYERFVTKQDVKKKIKKSKEKKLSLKMKANNG